MVKLFYHVPKTGGTTIKDTVDTLYGPSGIHGPYKSDEHFRESVGESPLVYIAGHLTRQQLVDKLEDQPLRDTVLSAPSYMVSRNPYSRFVSLFKGGSRRNKAGSVFEGMKNIQDFAERLVDDKQRSLELLGRWQTKYLEQWGVMQQVTWHFDGINVLPFEEIGTGWGLLEITRHANKNVDPAPWQGVMERRPDVARAVEYLYPEDFDLFGYERLS